MYQKRRFIAGAVCPRCSEMDKMVIYGNAEGLFRECIGCGYEDKQPELETGGLETGGLETGELSTRVNHEAEFEPEDTVVLKFYPKKKV